MALTEIDRRLLSQCLSRTPGAWHDFVDRFIGLFVHVIQHTGNARSVKLQEDDVEDLCAEIFVLLLQNDFSVLKHFRGQSSLATYLTVIARRVVVREIVRKRKAQALGHVSSSRMSHSLKVKIPAEALNGKPDPHPSERHPEEDAEEIRVLMSHLAPQDVEVVRRFYLEGKSYHQISTELEIPENSIGPILTRARQKLRQHA